MADTPATLDNIYSVANALVRARVPYVFIGGVAMGFWSLPRATYDLDVTVSISADRLPSMLRTLDSAGLVVDRIFESGFRDQLGGMEKVQVQLPTGGTLMTVDIFIASVPFLRSVMSRAVELDPGRGPIRVCSAADLIVFKLAAYRRKDQLDLDDLVGMQGIPEREYIEHWTTELGIRERLDEWL